MTVPKLEKFYAPNKYADFFWCLFVTGVLVILYGWIPDRHYLSGRALLMALVYIWCKKDPFQKVQFFFGFVITSILVMYRDLID